MDTIINSGFTKNLDASVTDLQSLADKVDQLDIPEPTGASTSLPAGVILPFGGSSAPAGYLLCDGSAVSRATYAALFSVIGTAFGAGDGSTTFNLPDLSRRVPVGAGGAGTAALGNALGNTGGAETHTLTTAEMPLHSHNYAIRTSVKSAASGTNVSSLNSGLGGTGSTFGAGSDGAHNNLQPSLVLNYLIKT